MLNVIFMIVFNMGKELYDNAYLFKQITEQMAEIYAKKNADYGDSFSESINKFGLIASAVRLSDKFNRFVSLIDKEPQVVNESIQDTLIDMANYAIMTAIYIKKHENNT